MASVTEAPVLPPCPPHSWLTEILSPYSQYWTCRRCGAEQEQRYELTLRHKAGRRGGGAGLSTILRGK